MSLLVQGARATARGWWLALALLGAAGCSQDAATPEEDDGAQGGKTDTPDDAPEDACAKRRADALEGNQAVFTPDAVRWSCADVEGVNTNNQDDRGQEYCEPFAVVRLPEQAPFTVGQITKVEPDATGILRVETTPQNFALTDDQIAWLEDNEDEVVAQCVFTSWHQDVPGPVPACDTGACPEVLGLPVDEAVFRMKLPSNSNLAASALVADCLQIPTPGDESNPDDPRHSDFYRACLVVASTYGTQWRRSDPAVCAAAARLAECGCSLPDNADVATSLVPRQPVEQPDGSQAVTLRGFPLGAWSGLGRLPAGCKHVDLGDGSQTVVACDVTALDLIDHEADLKRHCIEAYGAEVVVYVPIPKEQISCDPASSASPYADSCGEMPWVVER